MTNTGAGIHIVVAESGAHEFLYQIVFFVGAAARYQAANRIDTMTLLNVAEAVGCISIRFIPTDFAPVVIDGFANHGFGDAVGVCGVAPGETPFDAGMAFVGFAVFPRHHANHLAAFHFGLEAATHATVGAGGGDIMVWLPHLDQGFFGQCGRRAGIDAGATGDTLRRHKRFILTGSDARFEAAPRNRDGKAALLLFTGTHAAIADNALGWVVGEIRIRFVFGGMFEMVLAGHAITHGAQPYGTRHALQFTVAVGGAGQAIQRMIRDIQLHDVTTQISQFRRLGAYFHAGLGGCGAGRRETASAFDLDQAQAAGAKRFQGICCAELRNHCAGFSRRPHERGTRFDGDGNAVNFQLDVFVGRRGRCAEIVIAGAFHGVLLGREGVNLQTKIFREVLER